jgi:hypothetical protein
MFKKIIPVIVMLVFAVSGIGLAQEGTTEKPTEEVSVKPTTAEAPPSTLTVETEICTGVEERMPTGIAENFPADVDKVFLWCKVLDAKDTTIVSHVWSYKGEQKASVELPVKSKSWRTWSSKTILPEWIGDWEVKVLDADGKTLKSIPFKIVEMKSE